VIAKYVIACLLIFGICTKLNYFYGKLLKVRFRSAVIFKPYWRYCFFIAVSQPFWSLQLNY